MKRVMKITLSAVALSVFAMFPLTEVQDVAAHGGAAEIFRGRDGAYEIVVGITPASPAVGVVHLSVTPLDAQTSLPVSGAKITIVANDPAGQPKYQAKAVSSPSLPQYYDANFTIESPGLWTFYVAVESSLGEVTFAVPVDIEDEALAPGIAGTVLWLGVVFTLLGGALYVWYSTHRQRVNRQATQTEEQE